jgi:pyroglutamyl-peptidase
VTVLLTGFEPFRQWTVNSSGEAARAMAGRPGLVVEVLPVDHVAAARRVTALIAEHRPRAVLATGLSGGHAPRLELRARRPETEPEGPAELRGVWPWAATLAAARAAGSPAPLSNDAGRYVCETVYWTALEARRRGAPAPTAFLHVPPLSDAWPVERVVALMEAVIGRV